MTNHLSRWLTLKCGSQLSAFWLHSEELPSTGDPDLRSNNICLRLGREPCYLALSSQHEKLITDVIVHHVFAKLLPQASLPSEKALAYPPNWGRSWLRLAAVRYKEVSVGCPWSSLGLAPLGHAQSHSSLGSELLAMSSSSCPTRPTHEESLWKQKCHAISVKRI